MFEHNPDRQARCLHQLRPLPESARPWRWKCVLCGWIGKIASGQKLDMEPETPYPECLGCGYCCKSRVCHLGREVAGRCCYLYWNKDLYRYRCRLIETERACAIVLYLAEGCPSNLNSWRKEVKDRG